MESVTMDPALFTFRLPLVRPLPLRGGVTLTEREGCLVRAARADGSIGWGEASPLPTFNRETMDDVIREVVAWADSGALPQMPSARFAVESATRKHWPTTRDAVVRLNGLLVASNAAPEQARRLAEAGYRAVKLKVGSADVQTDIARVQVVHNALNGRATLRLDANRQWTWAQATRFAEGIQEHHIEYIEEPLADASRLAEFVASTSVPIALDESVLEMTPAQLQDHAYATAIVLKPTFGGGWTWAEAWHAAASALGMEVILSAAFESGVGLQHLVAMAAQFADGVPVGLDTYRWLAADLLRPRLALAQPTLNVADVLRHTAVDEGLLTRIA
ncbi:MAG: o-succinylbenzoate synthase [Bacteroidota bacterium]